MSVNGRLFTWVSLVAVGGIDSLLLAHWGDRHGVRGWVVPVAALVLNGLVLARQAVSLRVHEKTLRRLDGTLAALRKSMVRDQILADIGTGLLTAADTTAVHELAVEGAAALLADTSDALAVVLAPDVDELVVTAAAGTELDGTDTGLVGRRVAPPAGLRTLMQSGEVLGIGSIAELGVPGIDSTRSALILPLVVNGRFFGVIVATSERSLHAELRRALETLRTQVALALDGAALTAELTRRALHDPLTGLGNRALIGERMVQALARARRTGSRVGVLLIDLNGFKPINDTLGHEAGDELLRAVAGRLTHCVRLEDTVGRLGGDEFVVVLEDLPDLAAAARVAERVVEAVAKPIVVDGHELPASASVGVAISNDASLPDELLRQADSAMYTAKKTRKTGAFAIWGSGV
ncbi:sensor domain-containing diguanylate cyclase [Dactylosporangium vinaceum]|uniref:Diguanylate cyclase domain-containing protein n=1 Tax=Dactylosporangium vinaceum TaxID=53362 RepID=A0ABV5MGI2_9ACTN|nr:sensor domain-containing diguanylate cyclase [Dactylosporangium vinaceum]UAB99081.1 sensor domain-containing diguanylate cyclase [Dactylosporangium vinaceum]